MPSTDVRCKYCDTVKPCAEFTSSNITKACGPDGLRSGRCRDCHHEYNQQYRSQQPRIEPTIRYKKCIGCGTTKSAAQFTKNSIGPDGLATKCKECAKQQQKKKEVPDPCVSEKRCGRCSLVKPAEEFHRHISRKDGLESYCKSCIRAAYDAKTASYKAQGQEVDFKVCQRCHIGKAASGFSRDVARPDGLHNWCRACRSLYNKERKAAVCEQVRQHGPAVIHKTCKSCGQQKAAAEFTHNYRRTDGLHHVCKVCSRASANKAYQAKAAAVQLAGPLPVAVPSKRCPGCKQVKLASCYNKCATSPTGLGIYCKPCKGLRDKECKQRKRLRQQQAAAGAAQAGSSGAATAAGAAAGAAAGTGGTAAVASLAEAVAVRPGASAVSGPTSKQQQGRQLNSQHRVSTKRSKRGRDSNSSSSGLGDDDAEPAMPAAKKRAAVTAAVTGAAAAAVSQDCWDTRSLSSCDISSDNGSISSVSLSSVSISSGDSGSSSDVSDGAGTSSRDVSSSDTSTGDSSSSDVSDSSDDDWAADSEAEAAVVESRGKAGVAAQRQQQQQPASRAARDAARLHRQQRQYSSQQQQQQAIWRPSAALGTAGGAPGGEERPLNLNPMSSNPMRPQLLPGQLQVLGQTMTPAVAAAFQRAFTAETAAGQGLSVALLTHMRPKSLADAMLSGAKAYLARHISISGPGSASADVAALPPDLPLHPAVEAYTLPPRPGNTHIGRSGRPLRSCPLPDAAGDHNSSSRSSGGSSSAASLSSQRGVRVRTQPAEMPPGAGDTTAAAAASSAQQDSAELRQLRQATRQPAENQQQRAQQGWGVRAGDVIGPFSGLQAFVHEQGELEAQPLPGWRGTAVQWGLQFDAFSLDLASFEVPGEVCGEEAAVAEALGEPLALVCCAMLHGNATSLINDPRPDPLACPSLTRQDPQPNVMAVELGLGGWSFPVIVACQDIEPGQDLLMDYGNGYWRARAAAVREAAATGVAARRSGRTRLQPEAAAAAVERGGVSDT